MLATRDFPVAMPPVSPTLSMATLGKSFHHGDTEKKQSATHETRIVGTSPHLRRFHRIRHQHSNRKGTDSTWYWRDGVGNFRHFRVRVADEHRSLRLKCLLAFSIPCKKPGEFHRIGYAVHSNVNDGGTRP